MASSPAEERLAQVALDIPTQALDSALTYRVPADMDVSVGCAVLVPLGRRRAVGFVVGLEAAATADCDVDPKRIRDVVRCLSKSYFDENGAACACWMADRYLAPLSSCVRLFTPPGAVPRVVRRGRAWAVEQPKVGQVDDRWVRLSPDAEGFTPRKGAVKQAMVLDALSQGPLRMADLTAEYGDCASSVASLQKYGAVEVFRRRRMRGVPSHKMNAPEEGAASGSGAADPAVPSSPHAQSLPLLTKGQADALAAIEEADRHRDGHVVVVDGVTGSGKTEVYLRAIQRVIATGRTAVVLVPEISLTPQTVGRFRARFGDTVAVLHSRMSAGERYDQWDFIESGAARVVVGARSALFAPLKDVGLIVIDEEHEGSYKQDSAPRYVSRDVACWMARRRHATLVLGSATPSVEALYNARHAPDWSRVVLPERANGRPMPKIEVVDMAHEFGGGSRSMFSRRLCDAMRQELSAGRKAVLLLNQRGFAKFLLCRDCGYVPQCPNCSSSLTYHERGHVLVCHHCGYHRPAPSRCPKCGSPYLRKFGAGTQRVEAELHAVLSRMGLDVPVVRMDFDTTRGKGAHQRLLDRFAEPGPAVLLGTQMIAKGLDFADVTLVGVVNADTELRLPDFRAAERTFQLIEQVAGRAGRAGLPGRVLVQTYSPSAVPIRCAAAYDRDAFLADELPKRRELRYPPYARMASVLAWGPDEAQVRAEAESVWKAVQERVARACGIAVPKKAGSGEGHGGQGDGGRRDGDGPWQPAFDLFAAEDDPVLRAPSEDARSASAPAGGEGGAHGPGDGSCRTTASEGAAAVREGSGDDRRPEADGTHGVDGTPVRDPAAGTGKWEVFPAVPCPLSRLANKYRFHIVVKAPADADVSAVLAPVFRSRKANPHVNVTVDVDPESLL